MQAGRRYMTLKILKYADRQAFYTSYDGRTGDFVCREEWINSTCCVNNKMLVCWWVNKSFNLVWTFSGKVRKSSLIDASAMQNNLRFIYYSTMRHGPIFDKYLELIDLRRNVLWHDALVPTECWMDKSWAVNRIWVVGEFKFFRSILM